MKRTAYYNGNIYTADPGHPTAEAFVTEEGRFVFVGKNDDIPSCDEKIDLAGACVIPGLIDSHCHFLAGIKNDLSDTMMIPKSTRPGELGSVIKELLRSSSLKKDQPVIAMGIDLTKGDFCAKDIDCVVSDRPVFISSDDGHAALINTKAMEVLHIDRNVKDRGSDSYFIKDESGEPTGLIIEIPAMMLCKPLFSMGRENDHEKRIRKICSLYHSLGYTTVFDAMSKDEEEDDIIKVLSELDKNGQLPLRIATSFGYHGEEDLPAKECIRIMEKDRDLYSSDDLKCDTVKFIIDGTVEDHSALLFKPYLDANGGCGSRLLDTDELKNAAKLAADKGFNIHIHAIGDKAVTTALDTLIGLGDIKGRKTICHNQLYIDDDIKRMIDAGDIFFQTTPHWAVDDDYTKARLGEERFLNQFRIGTMNKNGVIVTFGSDCCLDGKTDDAFKGMYYACARGDKDVMKDECLPPKEESISREDALKAYTINGAMQLGLSNVTGSITVGKSADFVITDKDIINCPIEELKETKVKNTFFKGQKMT